MATWVLDPVVIPISKKSHSSMRIWVQSPRSLKYTCVSVCEFRLKFQSYIYIKKKD